MDKNFKKLTLNKEQTLFGNRQSREETHAFEYRRYIFFSNMISSQNESYVLIVKLLKIMDMA